MTTRDTLHFLTCGHVDDGKSTLIGRLLYEINAVPDDQLQAAYVDGKLDYSRLTDGLEDERAQGITIDVAYRYFKHEGRHYRIADTPGHTQYVRNMAVAAANSDCALILIDASHGVREQTLRHSRIAAFFGIRDFIIVVNKMDLVGYSQAAFDEIVRTYRIAMQEVDGMRLSFIPVSARAGDNLIKASTNMRWYAGANLLQAITRMRVPAEPACGARLPVQYVIRTPDGRRGYMGRLSGGSIKLGDTLKVADSGQDIAVSELYHGGRKVSSAQAGQAIIIASDDDADISRGNMLYAPKAEVRLTEAFIGNVLWLEQSFTRQENVQAVLKLHHFEEQAELHIEPAEKEMMEARIFTASPMAIDAYAHDRQSGLFILIQPETEKVIGVGTVRAPETAELNFAI